MFEEVAGGGAGSGADSGKSDLTKAVEKAVASATPAEVKEEATEETVETTEEATEETTEEGEEEDLSAEHLQRAKDLYKALSNPATAVQIVEMMARNAGLIKDIKEGEVTEKKAVKTITDVIREELGEDYKFLGAKLGKIIPDVVERMIEEKTQDIRDKQAQKEKEDVSKAFSTAFETLGGEFEDFNEYHDEMNKLMDTVPVSPKLTATQYFRNLYILAKGNKGSTKKSTVTVDKARLQKSKDNVAARLATGGEVKDTATTSSGKEAMGLRDSIQSAIDKLMEKK